MKPPDYSWFPNWENELCVIVASGPSAAGVDLSLARGIAKTVVVNESYRLAPWADLLYGCDFAWWDLHGGVPEFQGLKVSQDPKAARAYPDIKTVTCIRGHQPIVLFEPKGSIAWGGNSGFQAFNFVLQFHVKQMILVGFDMRLDYGLHWHGGHPKSLHNPRDRHVEKWRARFDAVAEQVAAAGVSVINASPQSALTAYPKMSFEAALERFGYGLKNCHAA